MRSKCGHSVHICCALGKVINAQQMWTQCQDFASHSFYSSSGGGSIHFFLQRRDPSLKRFYIFPKMSADQTETYLSTPAKSPTTSHAKRVNSDSDVLPQSKRLALEGNEFDKDQKNQQLESLLLQSAQKNQQLEALLLQSAQKIQQLEASLLQSAQKIQQLEHDTRVARSASVESPRSDCSSRSVSPADTIPMNLYRSRGALAAKLQAIGDTTDEARAEQLATLKQAAAQVEDMLERAREALYDITEDCNDLTAEVNWIKDRQDIVTRKQQEADEEREIAKIAALKRDQEEFDDLLKQLPVTGPLIKELLEMPNTHPFENIRCGTWNAFDACASMDATVAALSDDAADWIRLMMLGGAYGFYATDGRSEIAKRKMNESITRQFRCSKKTWTRWGKLILALFNAVGPSISVVLAGGGMKKLKHAAPIVGGEIELLAELGPRILNYVNPAVSTRQHGLSVYDDVFKRIGEAYRDSNSSALEKAFAEYDMMGKGLAEAPEPMSSIEPGGGTETDRLISETESRDPDESHSSVVSSRSRPSSPSEEPGRTGNLRVRFVN